MTRRSWIPSLLLGLNACCVSGCLFTGGRDPVKVVNDRDVVLEGPTPLAQSPYHAHPPSPPRDDKPNTEPVEQAHFPDALTPGGTGPRVKPDEPPAPPLTLPPPPAAPVVEADKAPEPQVVTVLRGLLENHSADLLAQLQTYDATSRELLMTLLPLAARAGDGGLEHATPQETAVLLEQVRQLERVLRPRAALALDKVCFCRKINGFGDCEPWPADHAFQTETNDRRGERMQVYVEVRNFTSRMNGPVYETSLAGVVEICDFTDPDHPVCRFDFPACVDRSQTPRQDYFINFQFHLPRLPEGRYTLHIKVKDVLDAAAGGGAPRNARRSLDFTVAAPGPGRD